jgi:uncharacterized repeat protein (TIGR01451 family)
MNGAEVMRMFRFLLILVLLAGLGGIPQLQAATVPSTNRGFDTFPEGEPDDDNLALAEEAAAPFPYQSGFPIKASSWVVFSSPAVADIDNDGDNELLIGDGIGMVDGWDHTGKVLPGFPLQTNDEKIFGDIALGDLDGDSDLEIVAGTQTATSGGRGRVFVWHHNGTVASGWPQRVAWSVYTPEPSEVRSVALADIEGDSDLEVLAGTINSVVKYSGSDPPPSPNLYAWHANGTLVAGDWPNGTAAIYGAIAAGDLDGDGIADIVAGRDHQFLHAHGQDGSPLPGWPIATFLDANEGRVSQDIRIVHFNSAPVIADLDGDGSSEYIVAGNVKYPGESAIRNSGLLVLEPDGTRRPGWQTAALGNGILYTRNLPRQAPAIADLNGDGQLEIVVATYDGWIRAYQADRSLLWAFDFTRGEILFASEPVIGDIDGDGSLEIVFGTYDPKKEHNSVGLWGLEADGTPMSGFPLPTGAVGVRAAPTLADLDGDGDLEILAAAWSSNDIFAWDSPAPYIPARLPWPTGRHDLRRSAAYAGSETGPDLSASRKFATPAAVRQGERTTFVIRLRNTGSTPFTYTVRLTDEVPIGLSYVPGSLSAPFGSINDSGGLLRWSGVMGNETIVNITYEALVTTSARERITNIVLIDTVIDGQITRSGSIVANGRAYFLPLIGKEMVFAHGVSGFDVRAGGPDQLHPLRE